MKYTLTSAGKFWLPYIALIIILIVMAVGCDQAEEMCYPYPDKPNHEETLR